MSDRAELASMAAAAREAFARAEADYLAELEKVREECDHPELVEYVGEREPLRICTTCGAEDDGWGVGWTALAAEGDWRGTGEHRTVVESAKKWKRFARHRHPVGGRHFVGRGP